MGGWMALRELITIKEKEENEILPLLKKLEYK